MATGRASKTNGPPRAAPRLPSLPAPTAKPAGAAQKPSLAKQVKQSLQDSAFESASGASAAKKGGATPKREAPDPALLHKAEQVLSFAANAKDPASFVKQLGEAGGARRLQMLFHPDRLGRFELSTEHRATIDLAIRAINVGRDAAGGTNGLVESAFRSLSQEAHKVSTLREAEAARRAADEARAKAEREAAVAKATAAREAQANLLKDFHGALAEVTRLGKSLPASPRLFEQAQKTQASLEKALGRAQEQVESLSRSREALRNRTPDRQTLEKLQSAVETLQERLGAVKDLRASVVELQGEAAKSPFTEFDRAVHQLKRATDAAQTHGDLKTITEVDKAIASMGPLGERRTRLGEDLAKGVELARNLLAELGGQELRLESAHREFDNFAQLMVSQRKTSFQFKPSDLSPAEWSERRTYAEASLRAQLADFEAQLNRWRGEESMWGSRVRSSRSGSADLNDLYRRLLPGHEAEASNLRTRAANLAANLSWDVLHEMPSELQSRLAQGKREGSSIYPQRRSHMF